jgi:hypothetical protein
MEVNWMQILAMVSGNIAWIFPVLLWLRTESRTDARRFEDISNTIKSDAIIQNNSLRKDMSDILEEMREERREFHGRLCIVETKVKEGK